MGTRKPRPKSLKPKRKTAVKRKSAKTVKGTGKRKTAPKRKAAPPKRKAAPKRKSAPPKRTKLITGKVERLPVGMPIVERQLQSSNWARTMDPKKLPEVFERVLEASARKGPFEPQDVLVFNHGLKFLGPHKLDALAIEALGKLSKAGAIQVKVAETKIGTEVYLFLGDKPKLMDGVSASLMARGKHIRRIYETLVDYWGHADWWLWFETEESLYE